jgi:hypothetical protein
MMAVLTVTSQNKMARPPKPVMAVSTVTAACCPATIWLSASTVSRSNPASGGQFHRTSSRSRPKPVAAAVTAASPARLRQAKCSYGRSAVLLTESIVFSVGLR